MTTPVTRSLRVLASPLKGAHAAAWQSQFRACTRMACSAAVGSAACDPRRSCQP